MSLSPPQDTQITPEPTRPTSSNITHKKVGNYLLLNTIGKGTFSKVSLSTHLPTHQPVAIKILQKDKIKDKIDKERINREISILKQTSHPNISQLYEIVSTKNNFYLVMEYINGGDLFDYIYIENKLKEEKACLLFRQIISCVEYLSKMGICHRDIKPENILLTKSKDKVKLIDFGLSNFFSADSKLTSSCGSPCYASPEMISCVPYKGISTDLWSCGVVLYCMLVGCLPFDDDDIQCLYKKILIGEFVIPSSLSSEAIDLLKKILEVDPKKRITLSGIKKHKWFNLVKSDMHYGTTNFSDIYIDHVIVSEIREKFFNDVEEKIIRTSIKKNYCNKYSAMYYLYMKEKGIHYSLYSSKNNERHKNKTYGSNNNRRKNSDFNVFVINNIIAQNANNNIAFKIKEKKNLSKTYKPNKTPSPLSKQIDKLISRNVKTNIKVESSSLKSKTHSNSNDNGKERHKNYTPNIRSQHTSLNTTHKVNITQQQNKIISNLIKTHLNKSVSANKKKLNSLTQSFEVNVTNKSNISCINKSKESNIKRSLITPIFENKEHITNIKPVTKPNKENNNIIKNLKFLSSPHNKINQKVNINYQSRINKILFTVNKKDNKTYSKSKSMSKSKTKSKEKTKNLLLQKLFIPQDI